MYGLSNGENIFHLQWSSKVKSQVQTLEHFEVEYIENRKR